MARFYDYDNIELPEEERLFREGTHPAEVVDASGRRRRLRGTCITVRSPR